MKGITESLAGRVAIIDLLGLSQAELTGRTGQPFIPDHHWPTEEVTSLSDILPTHLDGVISGTQPQP